MNARQLFAPCLVLAAVALAPRAQACKFLDQEITDTTTPRIGVYDENGKLQREIAKAEVVHKKVKACNESLSLVRIDLTDDKSIWVDTLELKVPGAIASASTIVCIASTSAKASDAQHVVSSGAEPDSKAGCK